MAARELGRLGAGSTAHEASCFRMLSLGALDGRNSPAYEKHEFSAGRQSIDYVSAQTAEPVKLSILMAAYNEERTIVRAITEILQASYPCEIELIIVDDGSTDSTPSLLSRVNDPKVIVHRHSSNQGKGASILSAVSLATGTHIIPFDADLEYEPEDIANLLNPVIKGRCEVVYGVRLFGCNTVYQSYRYAVGNKMLTRIANILYGSYLSDLHTCLKLMPLAMLKALVLSEKGFGLDTQLTALLLRNGIRPFEVPVSYYSRSHEQGKKINWRDAVTCVWILLKTRVNGGKSLNFQEKSAEGAMPGKQQFDSNQVIQLVGQVENIAIASQT